MMEPRPGKRTVGRVAGGQRNGAKAALDGRYAHLIRVPEERDQERALVAFRHVRDAVHSVREDEFLVTGEHLEVLRRAGVPFKEITRPAGNEGNQAASG